MPGIDPVILRFEALRRGDDRTSKDEALAPVLIKYTAEWCGPCRAMPFDKVVASLEDLGLHFIEIDVDQHPDAVVYFGVSSIPAIVLLVPGREDGGRKHVGPYNPSSLRMLRSWVETQLGSAQ